VIEWWYLLLVALFVSAAWIVFMMKTCADEFWRGVRSGIYLTAIDDEQRFKWNAANIGDRSLLNTNRTVSRQLKRLLSDGWQVQFRPEMIVAIKGAEMVWADIENSGLVEAMCKLTAEINDVDIESPEVWQREKGNYYPQPCEE
jgi:hypothetical protein